MDSSLMLGKRREMRGSFHDKRPGIGTRNRFRANLESPIHGEKE